jgi:hypothetical protein
MKTLESISRVRREPDAQTGWVELVIERDPRPAPSSPSTRGD